jgi:membrane protease YdiL (CAAX protease family)
MKKRKNLYISMTRGEKVFGWLYLAFQLLALPTVLTAILSWLIVRMDVTMGDAVFQFAYHAVNFIAMVCIFHRFLRDSLRSAWRDKWNFLQAVVLGFVAFWACSKAFDWIVQVLHGELSNVNDSVISTMLRSNFLLMSIAVVVLAPLTEELLYRGLIFRNLWQQSKAAAYLLSMGAFALIHVLSYIGTTDPVTLILCFIQYLPAGLCLAWTYSKADNIFAPILVHALNNAIAIGLVR